MGKENNMTELVIDEKLQDEAEKLAKQMKISGEKIASLPLEGTSAGLWVSQEKELLFATLSEIKIDGTTYYLGLKSSDD